LVRRAVLVAVMCVSLAPRPAVGGPAEATSTEVQKTLRWLDEGRVEESAGLITTLAQRFPDDPAVKYLRARLLFYQHDYPAAVGVLDELAGTAAAAGGPDRGGPGARGRAPGEVDGFHALARSTLEATRGYVKTEGEHFIIHHAPGKDEVLVPFALEALERAREALKTDLGYEPPGKVHVEIFPSIDHLAKVSTLTLKEIQNSGTIALCKWNRLMITSPRALLRGYPWLDTLGHEYVHLVITRSSHNTVPIWLHEGLAKFAERRWRTGVGLELSPSSEHLLAVALRDNRLIPFEKMHPSLAKLPTQEDTAQAFAQLVTVVDYLVSRVGLAGVRQVIERMRVGHTDAQVAVAQVVGEPFAKFMTGWRAAMQKKGLKLHPGLVPDHLKFKKKGKKGNELADIRQKRARELARLGELLWMRHKKRAALVEYERAAQALGVARDPSLDQRLGRGYVELGRYRQAIAVAQSTLIRHPYHAPALVTLGESHLALGELPRARERFVEALRVNPFDPAVHCGLAEVAEKLRMPDEQRKAQGRCDLLRRPASSPASSSSADGGPTPVLDDESSGE
jgi:hypothetical protein